MKLEALEERAAKPTWSAAAEITRDFTMPPQKRQRQTPACLVPAWYLPQIESPPRSLTNGHFDASVPLYRVTEWTYC